MSKTIAGIVAYPITPFNAEGGINQDRLAALVDKLVVDGAHAIAPLGSTGESAYLKEDEWNTVVDTTVSAVAGRVPVIVGSADLTTLGAVRRAQRAQAAGADAVMVLPVSYWKLNDREVFEHYRAISDAVDIPIMAYNNPATSGVDMSPELLFRMVQEIEHVTMVKESTGDIKRMLRLRELSGDTLPFFNGSNPLVLEALTAGAVGWCTAAPCLRPQPCLDIYNAVQAGDQQRAADVYQHVKPLLEFIVRLGLPTAVKAGLAILGQEAGVPRRPLLPLDEEQTEVLRGILNKI